MDRVRAIVEWITRRKFLSTLIAVVIIGVILAARFVLRSSAGELSKPIQRGTIVDAVYGIGTVTPFRRFSYNPLVGGTVSQSYVREGDIVRKGQPLVATESTIIRSPFDGIVNYFPYRSGENTYATTPVLVVTDMNNRYIVASTEQQGALRVKVGQSARISFDSLRNLTFEGKVSSVYSYSGTFFARIDSVNLPNTVLPDMTCDVAIVIGVHENALLIPSAAFQDGMVWVKRGKSIPKAVPVKLGVIDGTTAEVIEGNLQPGDQVMIRKQVRQ